MLVAAAALTTAATPSIAEDEQPAAEQASSAEAEAAAAAAAEAEAAAAKAAAARVDAEVRAQLVRYTDPEGNFQLSVMPGLVKSKYGGGKVGD